MKKLFFILLFVFPFISFSQDDKAWAWDVNGKVLDNPEKRTIKEIFNKYFTDARLSTTETSFKAKDGYEYVIIHQKFSYEPLFLVDFNKPELSPEQVKKIPQIMDEFRERHKYGDVNIDENYMIEHDIKDAIKLKLTDLFFLETLGRPDNSYQSGENYKSYKYDGIKKSIVLIFNNGVIVDYKIHGGL